MALSVSRRGEARLFLVDAAVFPQTLAVLQTRAEPLDIVLESFDAEALAAALDAGTAPDPALPDDAFGMVLQLPVTLKHVYPSLHCMLRLIQKQRLGFLRMTVEIRSLRIYQ